jgi:hypothetical protein
MPVPGNTVYKDELSDMYVNETPKYDNVTTRLCKGRRKCVVTEENPEDILKFVFPEEVLSLANNRNFLGVDHKKNISAGE